MTEKSCCIRAPPKKRRFFIAFFQSTQTSRESVVAACVCLIGLYEALSPKNREEAGK